MINQYYIPADSTDVRGPWKDSFGEYVLIETETGKRVKMPVKACSEAMNKYLMLREAMLAIRINVGKGYHSYPEEPIIEEMDSLWSQLQSNELQYIKNQKSWKFV